MISKLCDKTQEYKGSHHKFKIQWGLHTDVKLRKFLRFIKELIQTRPKLLDATA